MGCLSEQWGGSFLIAPRVFLSSSERSLALLYQFTPLAAIGLAFKFYSPPWRGDPDECPRAGRAPAA
jgi:hypothetical protein